MMLPRRYGSELPMPPSSVLRRGGSNTRTPVSMPGGVKSEMNARTDGIASWAATMAPTAARTDVSAPTSLERDIQILRRVEQAGEFIVYARADRFRRSRDRAAPGWTPARGPPPLPTG